MDSIAAEFRPRKKAGPLRNGAERGKGSIWHAVPGDPYASRDALCGAYPAIMWSCEDGEAVTCPRCLRRLEAQKPSCHGTTGERQNG